MTESKMFKGFTNGLTAWANPTKDGKGMYFTVKKSQFNKDTEKWEEKGSLLLFPEELADLALKAPEMLSYFAQWRSAHRRTTTDTPSSAIGATPAPAEVFGSDTLDDESDIPF